MGTLLAPKTSIKREIKKSPTVAQAGAALVDPANLLTVVRLPLAAALWLDPANNLYFTGLLLLAALTDMLDGRVAKFLRRRRGNKSRFSEAEMFGAWLDPVCDKLFILSAIVALFVGFEVPLWIVMLIAAREIVLAPFSLVYYASTSIREVLRLDFHSDWLGKLTTVVQFCAVFTVLYLPQATLWLAIPAGLLGVLTAAHYLWRGVASARFEQTNPLVHEVLHSRQ